MFLEVNEGVIDGYSTHFARVKSCPGDQEPNTAKSVHSDLHYLIPGSQLWERRVSLRVLDT